MTPINYDEPPKSIEEFRQKLKAHVNNAPDIDALIASGALRAVGAGWYEGDSRKLPEDIGRYTQVRMKKGKLQYKPINLTKLKNVL
jgi:hypothetical protein